MADHPCTTCGHVRPPSIGDGACFSPSGCAVHGCYRVQAVAAADARAARAESESLAIALESAGRLREIWSAEYRAERAEAALRSIAQRCLHDVHGGAPADPACPACIARAALAPSVPAAARATPVGSPCPECGEPLSESVSRDDLDCRECGHTQPNPMLPGRDKDSEAADSADARLANLREWVRHELSACAPGEGVTISFRANSAVHADIDPEGEAAWRRAGYAALAPSEASA